MAIFAAVIFDLGGVVLPSPFEAWAVYEEELSLPVGFIRRVVAASGDDGAWARHERGELGFSAFVDAFESECAAAGGGGEAISGIEVMTRMGSQPGPRPEMLVAIGVIRGAGLKTGALTNNWAPVPTTVGGEADPISSGIDGLATFFDVIVESAVEGLRKPDPRIYELTCDRLDVAPEEVVFLDDLGMNLKPARAMGMTTIKVDEPRDALAELAVLLALPLVSLSR